MKNKLIIILATVIGFLLLFGASVLAKYNQIAMLNEEIENKHNNIKQLIIQKNEINSHTELEEINKIIEKEILSYNQSVKFYNIFISKGINSFFAGKFKFNQKRNWGE